MSLTDNGRVGVAFLVGAALGIGGTFSLPNLKTEVLAGTQGCRGVSPIPR